jgi:hypothetical protein
MFPSVSVARAMKPYSSTENFSRLPNFSNLISSMASQDEESHSTGRAGFTNAAPKDSGCPSMKIRSSTGLPDS